MCALCSQRLDRVTYLMFLYTSGILPQGSVKNSFMVAVEEISTGFVMQYHVETTVVSIAVIHYVDTTMGHKMHVL